MMNNLSSVNTQLAENDPLLPEIYNTLLLAGYFRIKIASLKPFDKVLSGLAWCIKSSNFQIDVEYNDEMQIGLKIKAAEQVCEALIEMRCPHTLEPFELQGLNGQKILPVVQWLVKILYETREQRQEFNQRLSKFHAPRMFQKVLHPKGQIYVLLYPPRKMKVNRSIVHSPIEAKIRIYSVLLEHSDAIALRPYLKLLRAQDNTVEGSKGLYNNDGLDEQEPNEAEAITIFQQAQSESFENVISSLLHKNRAQLEAMLKDSEALSGSRIVNPEEKLIAKLRVQIEATKNRQQALLAKIESLSTEKQSKTQQLSDCYQRCQSIQQKINEVSEGYNELLRLLKQLEGRMPAENSNTDQIREILETKVVLQGKLKQLKRNFKKQIELLEERRNEVAAQMPEIDEYQFEELMSQLEAKKLAYDSRETHYANLNRRIMEVRWGADMALSQGEIMEYQQCFVELFEVINFQIEQKRSSTLLIQDLDMIANFLQEYLTFLEKANQLIREAKKEKPRRELMTQLESVLKGMKSSRDKSDGVLTKTKSDKELLKKELEKLLELEKEYSSCLKNMEKAISPSRVAVK